MKKHTANNYGPARRLGINQILRTNDTRILRTELRIVRAELRALRAECRADGTIGAAPKMGQGWAAGLSGASK